MKHLRFVDSQESRFQASKRSNLGCAALLCGRFAYAQESSIQAANRSKMGSAVLKFADAQKSFIRVAKRSNVGSTVMKGLRFADTQESCFQALSVQIWIVLSRYMVNAFMKDFDLLILRNCFLRLGNVHKWYVPPCYVDDLLIFRNRVFSLRNDQICVVVFW